MVDTGGLRRALTGPQYFAVAFGCIVGVAWIVVFGDIVARAGAGGTALAIAVGGGAVLMVALCYSEMAARIPAAGGELVYAYGLGGPAAAYGTGLTLALIYTATCVFEAISIGQLSTLLFPGLAGPTLYKVLGQDVHLGALVLSAVCTVGLWRLSISGAHRTAQAQEWVTYLRITLMLAFLIVALFYADPHNLSPLIPGATVGMKTTAVFAVLGTTPFLFAGFNVVAAATEESATSMAVVGRALVLAIVAAGLFYIALVFAVAALVPAQTLGTLPLPAAQAFEVAMGTPFMAKVVLATAILGNLTAWNALLMAGSRVLFALGRARLAPASFAILDARHGTPVVPIAIISILSLSGLLLGRGFILPLVNIASACFGITYVVTCIALLKRRRQQRDPPPSFVVPGGLGVIVAATGASLLITAVALLQPWFATISGIPPEWITLVAWLLLSIVLWLATLRSIRSISEEERDQLLQGRSGEV